MPGCPIILATTENIDIHIILSKFKENIMNVILFKYFTILLFIKSSHDPQIENHCFNAKQIPLNLTVSQKLIDCDCETGKTEPYRCEYQQQVDKP